MVLKLYGSSENVEHMSKPALMYTYALNRLNLLLLLYSDIQYTHHEDVLYQIQNSDLIGKVFFSLKQINCLIGRAKN